MKSISKTLMIAGTVILFLVCILVGVLYYRNLKRGDEEMAVTIERNLQAYLNERVNSLNPEYLEKDENIEKIRELSEQVSKELAKKLDKEDYQMQNDEILIILKEELQKQIESASGSDKKKLTELLNLLNEYKEDSGKRISNNENRINSSEERINSSENRINNNEERINSNENRISNSEDRINGSENRINNNEERINSNENRINNNEDRINSSENRINNNEDRINSSENRISSNEERINSGENRLASLEILLKEVQGANDSSKSIFEQLKSDTDGIKGMLEQTQKGCAELEQRLDKADQTAEELGKCVVGMEERLTGNEKNIAVINQKLAEFSNRIEQLENGANVRIERWDAETQTLYLIPVEGK